MADASASASWLQELLSLMGYAIAVDMRPTEASPEQATSNSNSYWLDNWLNINADSLQPIQIQRLIGEDGVVIDSLQYLANVILNRDKSSLTNNYENHDFYTVELNGYRSKRLAELHSLAETAVLQVRETQSEFVIKQLSAADRRFIHQLLEEFSDIETHSQGREPNRHLIVKLV